MHAYIHTCIHTGHDLVIMSEFHHFAREVWQTGSQDDTFVQCDLSGEDPRCSNSLTPWDRSFMHACLCMYACMYACLCMDTCLCMYACMLVYVRVHE